jgi:hypothetical protein
MCFHGRSNSLLAGDSAAGTGVVSAVDEIEPDVMGSLQNRSRKCSPSAVLKGLSAGNESYQTAFPLGAGAVQNKVLYKNQSS